MSRYAVTDVPLTIYPAGQQPAQRVYNIGSTTLYLDEYSSASSSVSFPLAAGSSVVWDGNRALFAVCASGETGDLFALANQGAGDVGMVAISNTTANPVGVVQPVNGDDFWYWPCVTGEDYPPTLSSSSYSRVNGMPVVTNSIAGAYAKWPAPLRGPDPSLGIVVVNWNHIISSDTHLIGWLNSSNNQGFVLQTGDTVYRVRSAISGGTPVYNWPGTVVVGTTVVNIELRLDLATGDQRVLVNGENPSGIQNLTYTFNQDYQFTFLLQFIGSFTPGISNLRVTWEDTL